VLNHRIPISPAKIAFQLAGGTIPEGWSLCHLYQGDYPFEGRSAPLNALNRGDHFSQSAGIVAVGSGDMASDEMERGCIVKTLRWVAYSKFGYDPDHYFRTDPDAHDYFGFVKG